MTTGSGSADSRERDEREDGGRKNENATESFSIDRGALLVVLVLVPHSYPRNKFFQLYRDPGAAAVRRRAARLRSIIAELAGDADDLTVAIDDDGEATLSYRLDDLGATRVCVLDPTELALVKVAVDRLAPRPELEVDAASAEHIQSLVERLMG